MNMEISNPCIWEMLQVLDAEWLAPGGSVEFYADCSLVFICLNGLLSQSIGGPSSSSLMLYVTFQELEISVLIPDFTLRQ